MAARQRHDQCEEARDCVAQLRRLPTPQGDPINPLSRRNPEWAENLAAMLRKADLRSIG
jgi:hypothetical protein